MNSEAEKWQLRSNTSLRPVTFHLLRVSRPLHISLVHFSGFEWSLKRSPTQAENLWWELRILYLASLKGVFALEFARHGADVVAIEGREANNVRARFAAEALGIPNIEFITDDMRNFSQEKCGLFDVVFCSGILYLPEEEACQLVRSIANVCTRLLTLDTQVGLKATALFLWQGRAYRGNLYSEHSEDHSLAEKATCNFLSLNYNTSFRVTMSSLLNVLRDFGYATVSEILGPQTFVEFADRFTLRAIKRETRRIIMPPKLERIAEPDWEDLTAPHPSRVTSPALPIWRRLSGRIRGKMRI